MEYIQKHKFSVIIGSLSFVILIILIVLLSRKSKFKQTIITPFDQLDNSQPKNFPVLDKAEKPEIPLQPPVVPEEIGLAMVYPQGSGVGMSKSDSNSFTTSNPGPLLTSYTLPESYGESSITDPMGNNGASQGSRILKIKDTGNQMVYKPFDESMDKTFAGAYSSGEVQDGLTLINGSQPVDYHEYGFNPEQNLKLQTSPGQSSTLPNCETTYPNVIKYNDMCITSGDIPYGQVVDGKVNPRLVSRWESFTGDYSRENALNPIDGLLYPNLNIQT